MPTSHYEKLSLNRQEAIMASAYEEFTKRGFADASFNTIIKHSGLSKGSFYYYFDSKEDLFLTLMEQAIDALRATLKAFNHPQDEQSFWLDCERLCNKTLKFQWENGALANLIIRCAKHRNQVPEAAASWLAGAESWLIQILKSGRRLGAIRTDQSIRAQVKILVSMWLIYCEENDEDAGRKSTNDLAREITLAWRRIFELTPPGV